jgi:acyl-CoA dehydrogenase
VIPAEDQVEHDAFELPDELLKPLKARAKEIGLWSVRSPIEYGGGGLNLLESTIIAEETAKCRMGAYIPACGATGSNPPGPILNGTRDQIERFLVPAIREGVKAFVAISESSGGSDPARSIRTRAVLKGDKYIVNGTKMWITGAAKASWGLLFARTGEQGARGGITCFIIDGKPKGMTVKEIPVIRS